MLSYPDFVQKQIMVIFSENVRHIRFANENLVVEEDGKIIQQSSLHKIFSVFIIGEATISTKLIQQLKKFGVSLALMKRNLEVLDILGNEMNGNVILREKQYSLKGDSLLLAQKIVENKIANQEICMKKIREKDRLTNDTIAKLQMLRSSVVADTEAASLL